MVRWLPFLGVALFAAVLFFPGLGDRDLTSSHEARAAQNAQVILDEGQWLVPRLFDRHLELQKPPMYYWLVALFAWLGGNHVGAWAVRLPAALSALATVLFLYYLGVRMRRPLAGFLAAVILASCVHFTWLARVGRIDMPLTMTITLALGAFYLGRAEVGTRLGRILWDAFGYLALAIGLLLKGPIAVVLPIMVVGSVWLLRDRRIHWRTSLWWGVPLTFVVAAPWYVYANGATNNQLWEVFFWYHNVERGLGGAEALAAHPWWFYGPRMFVDLLPWSLLIPAAIFVFLWRRDFRSNDGASLGLIWFASMFAFLSCMRFKRADYLLPAYPGMAIFLAATLERWWQTRAVVDANGIMAAGWRRILAVGICVLMAAYAGGWVMYHRFATEHSQPYRAMAEEIRRQTRGPVVFFRIESHLLAYHLGPPVGTIIEWENLEIWTRKPRVVFYVMPEACAEESRDRLPAGALEEVCRLSKFAPGPHERPLVVLRSRPELSARAIAK